MRGAIREWQGTAGRAPQCKHGRVRCTNALPEAIRPAIVEHMVKYVKDNPDAWVFTSELGNPIRVVASVGNST